MRKKDLLLALLLWLAAAQTAWTADPHGEDPISEVKLKPESLPSGMTILSDVRATREQTFNVRTRVGFPLDAVVSQKLIYQTEQAMVSYIFVKDEKWRNYGYSRTIEWEGHKSFVLMKDGVIVQIATNSLSMWQTLASLFSADPVHYIKIKTQLLPEGWALMHEYYLLPEDLVELEQECDVKPQSSLVQEFIVARAKIKLRYFNCSTSDNADRFARCLAAERSPIFHKIVRSAGTVVVSFESQNEKLVQDAISHVNLEAYWELFPGQM